MPERYEACTGAVVIEIADTLPGILNILDKLFSPNQGEDVIVWRIDQGGLATVAALVLADGRRCILQGEKSAAPPAEDPIVATLERVFWPRSGRRK